MKTLSGLTAAGIMDDGSPKIVAPAVLRLSGKTSIPMPFSRQCRETFKGWYFESTLGAKVFIPRSELFSLVESKEPLFAVPVKKP
jgi:hypothetical protein